MADIPIIYSARMVRALLGGHKIMTRRLAWRPPGTVSGSVVDRRPTSWQRVRPGDRLWVRENFALHYDEDGEAPVQPESFLYAATETWDGRVIPSIHMPRRASRLTCTVLATRIEPLQQIPLRDVREEGLEVRQMWLCGADERERQKIGARVFGNLWSELHGRESWDANPEVVVLTFRVRRVNIDRMEALAA